MEDRGFKGRQHLEHLSASVDSVHIAFRLNSSQLSPFPTPNELRWTLYACDLRDNALILGRTGTVLLALFP